MTDLASFASMLEILKDPAEMQKRFGELTAKQKELEATHKEILSNRDAAEKAAAKARADRDDANSTMREATKARNEAIAARDKADNVNAQLDAKRAAIEGDSDKIKRQYADLAQKQKVLDEKDVTLTALSNELHLRKAALDQWAKRIREALES